MTMDLLKQIATSRLPISFYRAEDIDKIRILRAAGLIVALVPAPSDCLALSGGAGAAQVLAVTQKGREELTHFNYPEGRQPRWRMRMPRIVTRHRNTGAPSSQESHRSARPQ